MTSFRDHALELVTRLQQRHADRLMAAAASLGHPVSFEPVRWSRDGGRHGGGMRLRCRDTPVFQRASVNVSQVHYDDVPAKPLASATALSAIVHPALPHAPSLHLHVSWTALKSGRATWRIMADLNPSIPDPSQTARFRAALVAAAGEHAAHGLAQGDRYFTVPALGRTRGVAHFYLEGFDSGDFEADLALGERLERAVIDLYGSFVEEGGRRAASPQDHAAQLAYHTLYFFQVLTLDRGTTSGLLVHGDNDVGILGSLPAAIDKGLLLSWASLAPAPQGQLVQALAAVLPEAHPCPVTEAAKPALADAVRAHYRQHPGALALQARGDVVPPTVANHQDRRA